MFPDKQRLGELTASSPTYKKYWKISFLTGEKKKTWFLDLKTLGWFVKRMCVYLYRVFWNFLFSVLSSENKDAGKLWKTYSEGLFQFVLYFIAL